MRVKNIAAYLTLFVGMLIFQTKVSAQGYYFYNNSFNESQTVIELGVAGGVMNGMTDIGGSKKGKANAGFLRDFTFQRTKFSGGLYLAGTYKDFIAARIETNFGKVEAADSNLKGTTDVFAKGRLDRNLHFRSNVFEIGAAVELHPLFIRDYIDQEPPRLSPYVFAGVGFTKFNPQIFVNNAWHNMDELRLEGEGFTQYPNSTTWKKTALSFPLGIGLRYELSQMFALRFEVARHFLGTDYLDGVSQRAWVNPNDYYNNLPLQVANLAKQVSDLTPVQFQTPGRQRANPKDNDAFWSVMFKVGINLNRTRRY